MSRARPWGRIAYAPIDCLGVLVVISGHPSRATAGLPIVTAPSLAAGLAERGNSEGAPQLFAAGRIIRYDVSPNAEFTTGTADNHLSVDHQGHQRQIFALLVVLHLRIPEDFARLRFKRDDVIIGCCEVDLVIP